ncbi:hypothetical protein [Leptospira bandrabouensis]|uniref:hypothetical protein n=1 Tax=Leptospira bandrabouensis TaxID=2484903 RepID=UPI0030B8CD5B
MKFANSIVFVEPEAKNNCLCSLSNIQVSKSFGCKIDSPVTPMTKSILENSVSVID